MTTESSADSFRVDQRVHSLSDSRRVGTVKYIGNVEGYPGTWIGVDWDKDGEGKHDGSINGVRYFHARSELSASFVRIHNLSPGISLLQALELRYKTLSTKEEEDEMYVYSAKNNRVSVQLLGKEKIQDKLSRFDELTSASLSYLGVNSLETGTSLPNLKELDVTGNLISEWKDVGTVCEQIPVLEALNLSSNLMKQEITGLPQLRNIRILVLNNTSIGWTQVETLEQSLPAIEELHLMANSIAAVNPTSTSVVQGFNSLRLLNLDYNCITDWTEILKLSQLKSLEQLYLNNNKLSRIFYPNDHLIDKMLSNYEASEKSYVPFRNLRCLLLGANNINDLAAVDALNLFPKLVDIRLSDNPVTDPAKGGIPRFVLIARLTKVEVVNGSEVSARERKESEIRYVRLVMTKLINNPEEIKRLHPRFTELKNFHGIEDERPLVGAAGPQKMASGLLSVTFKCVGASMGEKPQLIKKLPGSTTVGKLKVLCETFFKLKSTKPKLFLQEEGSPLPILLDDEMASLMDLGVGNESTIIIDEES